MVLTFGGAGTVGWMMYVDTSPPFTSREVYTMNAYGERTNVFKAGETMLVHRDLCFLRDAPVTFGRSLSRYSPSAVNVNVNTTSGMLKKGCVQNFNVVQIPINTPPGHYRYSVVIQYSNNPLHNGVAELPAPLIEIVR